MLGLLFGLRPIGLALRAASRSWYTLRASWIWQWPVPPHKLTIILDRMHEVPIEDFIDLHTFQPREIRIVIEEYLYQAIKRGFREIRLIHGRGIGEEREIVHSMLKEHLAVISFRDAADRGSTYVLLRSGPPPAASPDAP